MQTEKFPHFAFMIAGILIVHAIIWVALPTFFEGSVRLDVAEGVINGPAFQLSYLRHPPLSSWLTGLLWYLGPLRYFGLFVLGQSLALVAFITALFWLRSILTPLGALVATLCFLISPFATYLPIQVNHNYGVIGFWALTLITAWRALERDHIVDWVLLGLSIGLGLWAKYSILHLIIPLIGVALWNSEWRWKILTHKFFIGFAVTSIVILPHALDVLQRGASTIQFATRTEAVSIFTRLGFAANFILNACLYNLVMGIILILVFGLKPVQQALFVYFMKLRVSKLDQFLCAAVIGPIFIIVFAALFGVRPRILWITPISISFIAYWGRIASLVMPNIAIRKPIRIYASGTALMAIIYIAARLIIPLTSDKPTYPEMDGPALARLADAYWKLHSDGPIRYIVSFDGQLGRQAIGSIKFDLFYSTEALEDNNLTKSPWINIEDMHQQGALVVALRAIPKDALISGSPITDIVTMQRPMLRHAKAKATIIFGYVPPATMANVPTESN